MADELLNPNPLDPIPNPLVTASGMTLRDYFAAAALTGLLAANTGEDIGLLMREIWQWADGMLIRRMKPMQNDDEG